MMAWIVACHAFCICLDLVRLMIVGWDVDAGLERHQIKDIFWRLCPWEEGPDDIVLSSLVCRLLHYADFCQIQSGK